MPYNLKNYHPVKLDDLIRLGREFDGGYVVSKRQIEKTDILLSFGINDDWSFEADFEKLKNIKILAYDYSVSEKRKHSEIRDYIGCMLGYLLVLRRSKVKEYWRRIKDTIHEINCGNINDIKKYFQKKQGRFFIAKYLGEHDDNTHISFDSIFGKIKDAGKLSVFIKMDIEGDEYKTLPCLLPYLDKINGLVAEFHGLNNPAEFEEVSRLLLQKFYVAHIHANNFGGCVTVASGKALPSLLEITFINKDLLTGDIHLSPYSYPLKGLDFPNNKTLDDIALCFNE
ncbi:MAG: hypothetical protein LBJ86_02750 [Spirochaetaceae bacterium]|jgi:hypothetical protein|nr:hypothetical protein [Spirochaetaceae bacterium]